MTRPYHLKVGLFFALIRLLQQAFLEITVKKWIILSGLISMQSYAASISTYRIYLDSEHREQKFMVKNKGVTTEKCNILFDYVAYSEGAENKTLSDDEKATLSAPAIKRLRYSPRQFSIQAKTSQYVAFSYKRQINDEPAEYRTYVNIKCIAQSQPGVEGINLSPTIVHSVPLIIRTGRPDELMPNLVYSQIKQQQNSIAFRLENLGDRSVYGDITLVDANGDMLKLLQKNLVIYPEMKYKDFVFSLPNPISKNMKVEFQETGAESDKKRYSFPLEGE